MQDLHEEELDRTVQLKQQHIRAICERSGPDEPRSQPLKILIVGKQSCGKSSLIDSIAAALSEDRWVEHATVGSQDHARQVTNFILQYNKCCNALRPQYNNIQLPTLIDVPGLLDTEPAEQVEKFLRLLMYGHIPNQESALSVYENCTSSWDDLVTIYSRAYDNMKVDRVLFVASAVDDLPARLMDCVMNAARPRSGAKGYRRREYILDRLHEEIPIYGVITKMDQVNDENRQKFEERRKELKRGLGLNEVRLLCCSNYCDDTDPDGVRKERLIPDLDVPILGFLREVCDRSIQTVNPDDVLRFNLKHWMQAFFRRHKQECLAVIVALCGAFQVFLLVFLGLSLFKTPDSMSFAKLKAQGDPCYEKCVASGSESAILQLAAMFVIPTFLILLTYLLCYPPNLFQWLLRGDRRE